MLIDIAFQSIEILDSYGLHKVTITDDAQRFHT